MSDLNDRPADLPEDPRWIHATLRLAMEDVRQYLRTFAAVAFRPARFAADWRSGELAVLGPIAFMSASAATLGILHELLSAALPDSGPSASLHSKILHALAPYLYYAAVGLLCHGLLSVVARTRRWSSSLAGALYSGAAMPTLASALALLGTWLLFRTGGATLQDGRMHSDSLLLLILSLIPLVWFYVALARVLTGLHSLKGWLPSVVVLSVAVATALLPSSVPLPVLHLHVSVAFRPELSVSVDIRDI
jgi:hypothetical protein